MPSSQSIKIEQTALLAESMLPTLHTTQEKTCPDLEPVAQKHRLLSREQGILSFSARVLDWARREDVPLLERLRYLCIVSSNLDEFFEVRAHPHIVALAQGTGADIAESRAMLEQAQALVAQQYALYNNALTPAFAAQGIRIVPHQARTVAQRRWVHRYFERDVRPLLVPVALDPAHPFPQAANKSLNLVVRLQGADAFGRSNAVAIVRMPRALPRLVQMPASVCDGERLFVSLSSMVRAHAGELFDGREVVEVAQFRVTRNTEIDVDEDEVDDLRTALREELAHRQYGQAVRLEVSSGCSEFLVQTLLQEFDLPQAALFRVDGPVNLVRLSQLVDLVNDPALMFAPWQPRWPVGLKPRRMAGTSESIMAQMRKRDILIHQPFEQFDAVLELLREAVHDPQVVAIKQTIYRTGTQSELMRLLAEAVRKGKEVLAVVELKARFDEEANINWAEALEAVGAQVVYGVVGLKTHAKMLLITRREGRGQQSRLRCYGHLSTGNYNPKTARLYTDWSYMTCDVDMTTDMDTVFRHLASPNSLPQLAKLVMAPFKLQSTMLEHLDACRQAALQGHHARIVVKANAMTDEVLIQGLIAAGQAGAQIDLIIRGACMLPPQVPGWTDNIRVRSIIGQFLEHSRVFYFSWGTGDAQNNEEYLYLSSADWMRRNMTRRVELAWPVTDPALRQHVIDESLVAYLHDDRDAWQQQSDGSYLPPSAPTKGHGVQKSLMARYG